MSNQERGQVTRSAAEVYEEFFVPALFAQWAPRTSAAAQVRPGDRVLDVACGTGILARTMAAQASPPAAVVGLDANPAMLAVGRRLAPHVEWREGQAERLPFDDADFDAVGSQFGLMFFLDRQVALQEMARVLRPGRSLAVAVWASLESSPGYLALAALLGRLFGAEAAEALRAPFCLGDAAAVQTLFDQAGLTGARVETQAGAATFPSLASWITTEIKGWVLADKLDDDQFARLLSTAQSELQPFVAPGGHVSFAAPAIMVAFTRPA
jgi:SAM-dependent methyltransferase